MPRIRTLGPEEVGPEVGAMYDRFQRQRGNIPNMFRTLAYRPEIALTAAAHMDAIFNTGTVDQRLKEMLAVRVSQINDCVYCRTSHTALAKKLGVTEALLDAMHNIDEHADEFTPAERAALSLAERMTTDARGVDEEVWAALREHYDEGEIVELAAVIGLFNYFNRFNDALRVEVTPPGVPQVAEAAREG
jgi:uncharacterized peroxidase-related enzyme